MTAETKTALASPLLNIKSGDFVCRPFGDYALDKPDGRPHESTDRPPEEFIARALEGLRPRGLFAAIVPQSLLVKKEKQTWRDDILKRHTLKGVIVLPDELFHPYAAATTAILLLEKGVPHASAADVFFARVENDGYKTKKGVRLPREGNQLPTILDAYLKTKSIPRLCGWSPLDPKEALWHPAAPHYIPTSPLRHDEVHDGMRYLARSRSAFVVRYARELYIMQAALKAGELKTYPMSALKDAHAVSTAPKTIGGCFEIYRGLLALHSKENLTPGKALVVSSSGMDNGAYGFYEFDKLIAAPVTVVPGTGSIGEAHVQEWPCGVTDHCYILVPQKGVPYELLYVAAATIRRERWRFSYGAQITPKRIAWLPIPTDKETLAIVREHLESAERIETIALREAATELADEADAAIARQRIADIEANPDGVLRGKALEKKLLEWQA